MPELKTPLFAFLTPLQHIRVVAVRLYVCFYMIINNKDDENHPFFQLIVETSNIFFDLSC